MKNIIKKKKNVYFSNMKQIIKHYPKKAKEYTLAPHIFVHVYHFYLKDCWENTQTFKVFVYVNGLDWFGVMVFTASFNDILVISYWSVLLVANYPL
jgi:hypothetical protein